VTEKSFYCDIQSRGQNGRIVVEIPKDSRDSFKAGEHVRVTIKKLRK